MKYILLFLTVSFMFLQGFSQKEIFNLQDYTGDLAIQSSNSLSKTKKTVSNFPKSSTVYVLDTFYFDYNYQMQPNSPFEPYSRVLFTYDNDFYLIDELQQQYNNDSSRYYDNSEAIYSRDANHNIIQEVTKIANSNGDLVPNSRTNYTYDANNNLIVSNYQSYDQSSQNWINSSLDSLFYNSQNLDTLFIHYNWNSSSSNWQPSYKRQYKYDAFNNKVLDVYWSYYSSSWYKNTLDSFYYQNGYLMRKVRYSWDNNNSNWVLLSRVDYDYDLNGNLTERTNYDNNLNIIFKQKFYYNTNNLIVKDTSFIRNNLQYYSNEQFGYDNLNNLINVTKQRYDTTAGQWIDNIALDYGYYSNGDANNAIIPEDFLTFFNGVNFVSLPQYAILRFWNTDSSAWINYFKFRYIFKTIVTSVGNVANSQQITLYPNPATNVININLPEEQKAMVMIYDENGRVVRSSKLVTGQISVKSLPTGTYFVVVQGKNKIYVGKFLKK